MGYHTVTIYCFFSIQKLLWIRIILIQIDTYLTDPNFAESCRTQLKLVTSQIGPKCNKQTTSYANVHNFRAMFSLEDSVCHRLNGHKCKEEYTQTPVLSLLR